MALTAGGVFGAVIISLFTPVAVVLSWLFFQRREIQPIKARHPLLVTVTDVILILYVMLLCFQRIFEDSYPCWLNLWSAYIGTIILFNTYIWRCWTLYYNYFLTEEKNNLTEKTALVSDDMKSSSSPTAASAAGKKQEEVPFFIRNREYAKSTFLFRVAAGLTVLLMIPCIAITGSDSKVRDVTGQSCDLGWAQTLLAVYVLLYVLGFAWFAYQLRVVADGFRIKEELRWTGLIGIIAVIPWVLFNRVDSLKTINNDKFPVSTLSLIVAVFCAFYCSTVWPLMKTYSQPGGAASGKLSTAGSQKDATSGTSGSSGGSAADEEAGQPKDIETLDGVLSSKEGFESFRKFLTAEFSVENLLFWKDVEEFRKRIKGGADEAFIRAENQRLFDKYIIEDGPFWVNLKEAIVKKIREAIDTNAPLPKGRPAPGSPAAAAASAASAADADNKDAKADAKSDAPALAPVKVAANMSPGAWEHPTIFDEAQAATFKLMKSDPFPRYKSESPLYEQLVAKMGGRSAKKSTAEMTAV